MKTHVVQQGETLPSIAKRYGFRNWKKVYLHEANQDLRQRRPNPNVLHPGDQVAIPDLATGTVSASTEATNRFKVVGHAWTFRLVLRDDLDAPIAGEDWELVIDQNEPISGTTGDDGLIECVIEPSAKKGTLRALGDEFSLFFGALNPVARISGIQQRLNNLGFAAGVVDDRLGTRTRRAISQFQRLKGLEPTGELDDETRRTIQEEHDGDSRVMDLEDGLDSNDAADDDGENLELAADDSEDPTGDWQDADEESSLVAALNGEEPVDTWASDGEEGEDRS